MPQPFACRLGCFHHPFHNVFFLIYLQYSISWPNLRLLAVIVFEISLFKVFYEVQSLENKNVKSNNSTKKITRLATHYPLSVVQV